MNFKKREGSEMTKQKVGLVLFWIAVIWAILWGVIGSVFVGSAYRNLTMDELNLTMWAYAGPWSVIWGKYGIGIVLAVSIGMAVIGFLGHIPPLFGIGGTLILLFFIGILWLWAKERMALKGASTTAADLKLVGYVFMLIAAWYVCGIASQPFLKVFEGEATATPIHVMIFLVLGWLFLFLSHYKSRKQ